MTSTDANPPPYASNEVKVDSATDSKIIHVHLYPWQAEISRLYNLKLAAGQNKVLISGLPNILDEESLRYDLFLYLS